MAIKNRTDLKSYFETGDIPTQGEYSDLIDSQLNLLDTSTQIVVGEVSASSFKAENHITASGNISSSGTISAATLTVDSYSDINLTGNLTASGDISASGDLYLGGKIKLDITASGNISSSGIIFTDDLRSGDATKTLTVDTDDLYLKGRSFRTDGHITSSGNISSSGTITGNHINGTLQTAAQPNITSVGTIGTGVWQGTAIASAYLDADTAHLTTDQTFSGNKTFSAHITSSNNISSSATLIAQTADIKGDITASGVLKGDKGIITGTLTAATLNTGQGANELYDMDQNVTTNSSPTFAGIKIRNADESNREHTWDSGLVANSRAFSIVTEIPAIGGNRNSTTQTITNNEVDTYSVVVGTTSTDIGVHIVSVSNGSFSFYLTNTGTNTSTADSVGIINFIVLA